jgi:hypothetical protein
MKNLFKAIIGRIKLHHTSRSLYSFLNESEESAALLTFICPGCGFHLQLPGTPLIELSNGSKSRRTLRRVRHVRSLPLATDPIAVLEEPSNMTWRSHHAVHPPTTEQVIPFEEPMNTASSFPHTDLQPQMQSSHVETNQRSQFKFPREAHQRSQFKFPHRFVASEPASY